MSLVGNGHFQDPDSLMGDRDSLVSDKWPLSYISLLGNLVMSIGIFCNFVHYLFANLPHDTTYEGRPPYKRIIPCHTTQGGCLGPRCNGLTTKPSPM
jgi:hypothetical protein